jgi:hypothetical protein
VGYLAPLRQAQVLQNNNKKRRKLFLFILNAPLFSCVGLEEQP